MSRPLCFDMFRPTTQAFSFLSTQFAETDPHTLLGRQVDEMTAPAASKCTRSTRWTSWDDNRLGGLTGCAILWI